MKLIYRGISYEYDPTQAKAGNTGEPTHAVRHTQTPYALIYRGHKVQVDPQTFSNQTAERPDRYTLIYRGATYSVTRNGDNQATARIQSTDNVAVQSELEGKISIPSSLPRRYIGKVHQANLLKNLQHRLQVAREHGDQKLIELLEAERKQIIA
jgi:hypothetical protein